MSHDPRLDYPATGRNRDAIAAVLREFLPSQGTILEIASGSGQHTAYFASLFRDLTWQPTDIEPELLHSIDGWAQDVDNIGPAIELNVLGRWPKVSPAAILCINMLHISEWGTCAALMQGAEACLNPGAPLILYGPFRRNGEHTAPSNATFDQSLRQRNPAWGVRNLEDVVDTARSVGLTHVATRPMPANNLSVVFRKKGEVAQAG